VIAAELRMQRDTHQTALATRLNIRHDKQRLRPQRAILKNAHTAGTLGKDHATVGCPNNGPRHFNLANHGFDFEAYAALRRTRDLTRSTPCRRMTASNTKSYCERNDRIDFHLCNLWTVLMLNILMQQLELVALLTYFNAEQVAHREHSYPAVTIDNGEMSTANQLHAFERLVWGFVALDHRA